ncbi:serine/threonine-protein kinase [Gordonia sp. ABSL1-1]|uniref:serine/threonine-protein kinase n=1 Tax=Gordonia sp. ABSL1-1 TaxID=3053923 RepID=UPI002573F365|nr:serine/threonine-protein kinase [Gordonia sp. ABSL1-1]MDL9938916.1 serine/threonine-protein kinase [Gordonia sp. ABSL1-1]
MFEIGDQVDGYTIDHFLGGGSSADVFAAHQRDQTGLVALKVLHAKVYDRARLEERFDREFTIARMLEHPHIVRVHSRGRTAPPVTDTESASREVRWMTMQYVAGAPATILVPARGEEPDVATVLAVAGQIADALDYAHDADVIHRDVKPANILTTITDIHDGHAPPQDPVRAYLSDFGIAQLLDDTRPLARNGRVQGSIAYAAPELLQAQRLSAATDQYALACSLVEFLTGEPPYPRATPFAITYAHINDDPPKPSRRRRWLPSGVDSIVAKALAKDPAARYDSCGEFVALITRMMRDVPVPDHPRHRRFGLRRAGR